MVADEREKACDAPAVPATMAGVTAGYCWSRDSVGESGGAVYRLHGTAGAPDLYLKQGRGRVAEDLGDEMVRLRWLGEHVPVPAVLQFVRDDDEA